MAPPVFNLGILPRIPKNRPNNACKYKLTETMPEIIRKSENFDFLEYDFPEKQI